MIRMLARDALRITLRPRTLVILLLAGALLGSFVRATQHTFEGELAGMDARGAAAQSLLSGWILFASCAALVFGVMIGHEDRASGFVAQLAIRPVSRFAYATGRFLGVGAASATGALMLAIVSAVFAGFSLAGLPELRELTRASSVAIGGRTLARTDVAVVDRGETARFRFTTSGAFRAELRLEPQVTTVSSEGERFGGFLDFVIVARRGDDVLARSEFPGTRPIGSVTIAMASIGPGEFDLEVENRTQGAGLVVTRDHVVAAGGAASPLIQTMLASVLLLCAASIVAGIGFAAATALSSGPAALLSSFVLLVALARDAVVDLARTAYPFLTPALRVVPDLARFDSSERFARGEALGIGETLLALGAAGAWLAGLLAFAAFALSWRDRE